MALYHMRTNTINQFFCDIPKKNQSEIVPAAKKHDEYILNLSHSSVFIQPTTEDEAEKYNETLKNHKTNGLSSLANKLLKQFKKCLKNTTS